MTNRIHSEAAVIVRTIVQTNRNARVGDSQQRMIQNPSMATNTSVYQIKYLRASMSAIRDANAPKTA